MSAQRLRDAAKVLRERAEAVPESPWYAVHLNGEHLYMNPDDHTWVVDSGPSFICDLNGDHAGRAEVATYIATMHPGVALALAEWLDAAAREEDAFECGDIYPRTVADLILGADS